MEHPLEVAERTYVDVDIHKAENASRLNALDHLPASCVESADALEKQRDIFESHSVFEPRYINAVIERLRSFDDSSLHERAKQDTQLMERLVEQYFHV